MSRPEITISINSATAVNVESLGCQVGPRTRSNQAADVLPLTFPRRGATASPLAYDDKVQVWVDGGAYFTGRAGQPGFSMTGSSGAVTVPVFGPWKILERWPAIRVYSTNAPAVTNTVAHASDWTPRWQMFSYPAFAGLAPTGYAVLQLLFGPEYVSRAAPHFVTGAMPAGVVPPAAVEINGSSVAAGIIQALRSSPDVALWWDYSVSPPALKFTRMVAWGAETSYAFNRVTSPWGVTVGSQNFGQTPTALTLADAVSYDLTPAHELNPSVLALRTEAGSVATQWHPTTELANAPDALWVLNTQGVAGGGTAAALFASRGGLRVDGEFTLVGDRPDLTIHPGKTWSLTGDDAATGAADGAVAWTQQVVDNLATGETRVRLGFPRWLGEGDRLGNWHWCRKVGLSAQS